jgi:hypothetical protein
LRALGHFGVTRFDFGSATSIMGGARAAFRLENNERILPFVHVLIGMERCCGGSDFAIEPGGGIFYRYSPAFDIVVQANFRRVSFEGGSDMHQQYSVGLSIPIATR